MDAAARTPSEAAGGLRAPYRGPALTATPDDPWSPLTRLLIAPAIYVLILGVATARRSIARDSDAWSRRGAVLGLNKDLARLRKMAGQESSAFYSDLADLCARQVAARLGISPAEVTPHDVPRLVSLGVLSAGAGKRLQELLEEVDLARFSPHSMEEAAQASMLERARGVIRGVKSS